MTYLFGNIFLHIMVISLFISSHTTVISHMASNSVTFFPEHFKVIILMYVILEKSNVFL